MGTLNVFLQVKLCKANNFSKAIISLAKLAPRHLVVGCEISKHEGNPYHNRRILFILLHCAEEYFCVFGFDHLFSTIEVNGDFTQQSRNI